MAADATAFAERNLGVINAYVGAHAAEGGTPWLDWINDPPRLVIGFTSNVAQRREELASLLVDPDRVFVCKIAHSQAEVSRVAGEIQKAQTSSAGGFPNTHTPKQSGHFSSRRLGSCRNTRRSTPSLSSCPRPAYGSPNRRVSKSETRGSP